MALWLEHLILDQENLGANHRLNLHSFYLALFSSINQYLAIDCGDICVQSLHINCSVAGCFPEK